MYKSIDIAAQIIKLSNEIGEPITNMKLQKLIYYVYAWYAVEKGKPLFDEPIYAWKYGPVIASVYRAYQKFGADVIKESVDGDPESIDDYTKKLIEEVFNIYGTKSAIDLMELTHSEAPWRDTYKPGDDTQIPFNLIQSYYKARKDLAENSNVKK